MYLLKFQNAKINIFKSLSEIAEEFGITKQAVADLVKRSVAKLDELEKNLKFCAKLDEICSLIPQKCKKFGLNDRQTAEIINLVKMVED